MENFRILRYKKYYLIYNLDGEYNNHVHVPIYSRTGEREYYRAKKIVNIIQKKQVPFDHYMVTSALRLTLDDNYSHKLRRALKLGKVNYRTQKYNRRSYRDY